MAIKRFCQPIHTMSGVAIKGAITPPSELEDIIMVWALVRSSFGKTSATALELAAGYPPSPRPNINRMIIMDIRDQAIPVKTVKSDQTSKEIVMIFLDPNLSASQPPGNCIIA